MLKRAFYKLQFLWYLIKRIIIYCHNHVFGVNSKLFTNFTY